MVFSKQIAVPQRSGNKQTCFDDVVLQKIIHRDIKSHNIFITEPSPGHYIAKIGDWGSARAVALTGAKSMTQGVGTACWLAPEVINYAHASKDSDVYAFGIVLWEVFTRAEVYEGLSAAQIIAKVANEGLRPKVPRDCPWGPIMAECWHHEASQRPGFHRVMTSLSKLYSRAKNAHKGRNQSLSEVSGGELIAAAAKKGTKDIADRFTEHTPLIQPRFVDTRSQSDTERVPRMSSNTRTVVGAGIVVGGAGIGSMISGLRDIYFNRKGAGVRPAQVVPISDQFLSSRPRIPSKVLSDPTMPKRKSPGMNDVGGDMTNSPRNNKSRSHDAISSEIMSSVGMIVDDSKLDMSSAPSPKRSTPRSRSRSRSPRAYEYTRTSSVTSTSGQNEGNSSLMNMNNINPNIERERISTPQSQHRKSVFKADVDLGDGRLSPVEYVIIESTHPPGSPLRDLPSDLPVSVNTVYKYAAEQTSGLNYAISDSSMLLNSSTESFGSRDSQSPIPISHPYKNESLTSEQQELNIESHDDAIRSDITSSIIANTKNNSNDLSRNSTSMRSYPKIRQSISGGSSDLPLLSNIPINSLEHNRSTDISNSQLHSPLPAVKNTLNSNTSTSLSQNRTETSPTVMRTSPSTGGRSSGSRGRTRRKSPAPLGLNNVSSQSLRVSPKSEGSNTVNSDSNVQPLPSDIDNNDDIDSNDDNDDSVAGGYDTT